MVMIIIRRLRKAVLITALILVFEVASLLPQRGIANSLPAEDTQESHFRALREAMVKEQIADPPDYRTPVRDRKVLDAMLAVPRHLFVNPSSMSMAYADHPFPIGFGQTISQPYIVALMTELLEIEPGHKVLEVGTGSRLGTRYLRWEQARGTTPLFSPGSRPRSIVWKSLSPSGAGPPRN